MSFDSLNLWSVRRNRHGGQRGDGHGKAWFRDLLVERGFPVKGAQLLLLAQPSFLWFHFNPVSFWIAMREGKPRAIVAEVNNTFGHRHCYFCAHENFEPIEQSDTIIAEKLMHVSPFQQVSGQYLFNFHITDASIDIRISYQNGAEGVLATLEGERKAATDASLLWAALRRPFGAARTVALIHWQALILYLKCASWIPAPKPPDALLSDSQSSRGTEH